MRENWFLILLLLAPKGAFASDFTWVNRLTFLSEYYSRGISQTLERPAPQYETTLFHKSGFFGGMFISRVEFLDGGEADQELDFYIGYNELVNNWGYRIGLIHFTYPNSDSSLDYSFSELDLGISYNFDKFQSEVSFRYSPDHFADSGDERYIKLISKVPLTQNLKIKGHIAHRSVEDNQAFFNIPDSFDWEMGLEYTPFKNTDFIVKYVDSTFTQKDCLGSDLCNERIILGINYNF